MATEIIEVIAGILISLGIATGIVLSLYFYFKARNKERMAMIEKGNFIFEPPKRSPMRGLKFGLLLSGIGTGIFFGHILDRYSRIPEEPAYFSMILLFGGLSLILGYLIEIRQGKSNK